MKSFMTDLLNRVKSRRGLRHVLDPEGDLFLEFTPQTDESTVKHASIHLRRHPDPEEVLILRDAFGSIYGNAKEDETFVSKDEFEPENADTGEQSGRIIMQVASRQLVRASSVFKAMLDEELNEGKVLPMNSGIRIQLPHDHPADFLILMSILHNKASQVPSSVSVSKLISIARHVDKYKLQDSIIAYSRRWIQDVAQNFDDDAYTPQLYPLMGIAWSFGDYELFARTTRAAELWSTGTYESDDRLLPNRVLEAIQRARADKVTRLVSVFADLIKKFWSEGPVCPNGNRCDWLACGALIMGLGEKGILEPFVPASARNDFMCLGALTRELKTIEVPKYCRLHADFVEFDPFTCRTNVHMEVYGAVEAQELETKGFSLDDFYLERCG